MKLKPDLGPYKIQSGNGLGIFYSSPGLNQAIKTTNAMQENNNFMVNIQLKSKNKMLFTHGYK